VFSLLTLAILNLTTHRQAFGKSIKRDGRLPLGGLIMDSSGNLYGTTATGGAHSNGAVQGDGTVFKLTCHHLASWARDIERGAQMALSFDCR
jgi:hypothetical protein